MTERTEPALADFALRPLHWRQICAIATCVALSALDGFDVLAITFAGPGIAADWGLRPTALGAVISAGLLGMGTGSVLIGQVADRIGRRPTIFVCLAIMALGTVMTAATDSVSALAGWRLFTGFGIGGMLPTLSALASEHSNEASRDFSVSLMTLGYPCGGLLGGLAAAQLVQVYDWRAIFLFASAVTILLAVTVYCFLPETVQFLSRRQPANALGRLNRTLARFGRLPVSALPPKPVAQPRSSLASVFSRPYVGGTVLLLTGFFFQSLCFYFLQGWLPKLLTDRGFSAADAINTAAVFNGGAIIGGVVLSALATRVGLRWLLLGLTIGFTFSMQIYSLPLSELATVWLVAGVMGACGSAAIVAFYAIVARYYPVDLRATGAGVVLGCGRSSAAVGPVLGGAMLEAGFHPGSVVRIIGLFSVVAGVLLFRLRPAAASTDLQSTNKSDQLSSVQAGP
jgi:benzoate transport